jgi:hypothetical protein
MPANGTSQTKKTPSQHKPLSHNNLGASITLSTILKKTHDTLTPRGFVHRYTAFR